MYDENKWNDVNDEESKNENTVQNDSASQETAKTPETENAQGQSYPVYSQGGQPQSQGSAYGQGSQLQSQGSTYGQGSQSQSQGSTYGQGSQPQSQGSTYGQEGQPQSQGSAYGQGSQPQGQNPTYGQGGQSQNTAYGQNGERRQVYGQAGQTQGQQGGSGYGTQGQYYQNGQGYQNRAPYQNPYQYNYYQNPNGNQNGMNQNKKAPKKKSYLKTTALVTAAALLFGVVSGGTMFGVNRAAQMLFPASSQTTAETQAALESTTPIPATPQSSQQSANSVIIEDVSPIVEEVMPSVVAITNTMVYTSNSWFGPSQTYEVPSSGSGIIVGENDSELLIVTNNHVIEDSDSLSVTFIDNSTVDAAIKGTDSESDLAVIAVPLEKISADTKSQIKAATLGDSDSLKMGQGVIAIGNALGLGQSVTVGHVSALDREITVDDVTKKVIQTDAAINPGNSGGALLNASGEVIGINEAKYANTNVEGVGYAIPISQAKDIIEDLKSRTTKIAVDESEQGYLGIQLQNIDSSMAKLYGMPEGVYVYKITEGSAAANSELREKDIITKLDGENIRNYADLSELLTYYKAGTTITLTVQSLENGEYVEREVQVTLKNRPAEEEQEQK